MQINHLRYFMEVARCGSINQASQILFISPQALSSSIASLENEMGCKLFRRHHQGMILTAAGQQVYDDLQDILPKVRNWFELGQKQTEGSSGRVEIYVALSLCSSFNRFLIEKGREYPELEVTMREARSNRIRSLAQSGKTNLGLISVDGDSQKRVEEEFWRNKWTAVKLMEDDFCLVLGRDYFPEYQDSLTWDDCAKMCYISSADDHDPISLRFAPFFGHRMQSKSESLSSNLCMVALNEGAVAMPRRVALCEPLCQSGMLRVLPVKGMDLKSIHYVFCARMDSASQAERFLMDQIVDFYTNADWEQVRKPIKVQ